jgi:hypothetical protein
MWANWNHRIDMQMNNCLLQIVIYQFHYCCIYLSNDDNQRIRYQVVDVILSIYEDLPPLFVP